MFMPEFDPHSLEVLEYGKVLSILRGLCLTAYGLLRAEQLAPMTDRTEIEKRLAETSQMKDIIRFGEAFPLYRLDDINETFTRSRTEGIHLEPLELLKIKEFIEVTGQLHEYARSERDNFPLIDAYLTGLHSYRDIHKAIDKTIDHDGSILDGASSRLKEIRGEIFSLKRKIVNALERILASRSKHRGWQDDTVTIRDGRYVIPFLSGDFRPDAGIIHDRSQSGATLYVEPKDTVESNNKLGHLFQEERLEIDRILRAITAEIALEADNLLSDSRIIGELDCLHAGADFAIKIDAHRPILASSSRFNFIAARHPLLMYYTEDNDDIIANDVALDKGRLALIITGPNTGGKTVLLKTVGLLILMAQTGLHIPADEKSELGLFTNIFADIGDEQSIELSLSTFSSHVRQIIYAVTHTDDHSLVLLDEIGAGTDPKEGAALAESILLYLIGLETKAIVTTHYSQLKTLPMMHPELENASFEFDRKSLKPTYRLQTGLPGASYAVEIAGRLGMPAEITAEATGLLGKGERSLSGLIESLEKDLEGLRKDKAVLEEKLKSAGQLEDYYRQQQEKFEREAGDNRQKLIEDLEQTLARTRVEIERLVKNIRESSASKQSVKELHAFLRNREKDLDRLKRDNRPGGDAAAAELKPGDRVWVDSLGQDGELVEIIGPDRARVRIGNIMSTVNLAGVRPTEKAAGDKKAQPTSPMIPDLGTNGPEVHLLGMTVDEATEVMDRFFDKALVSGIGQVYVVHGKGTGALRKAVAAYLRAHKAVASFRLGNWNEGGAGVTIVQLKK